MHIRINKNFWIDIPNDLWKEIVNYYKDEYTGVIPNSYPMEDFARHRLHSAYTQLERLKALKIKTVRGLDAGCGIGLFVLLANLAGFNFYGYDVDRKAVALARKLFKAYKISPKKIGTLPHFANSGFDLITSFEVVEHLGNMDTYFNKLSKVILPTGNFFLETPNYIIPYEPHYYTLIFPLGPRSLKWLFCWLKGARNKKYFDGINFVNKYNLETTLRRNGFDYRNIGVKEWIEQMVKPSSTRSIQFINISKFVKKFRLLLVIKFFAWLGLYTPLVYLAYPEKK